MRWLVFISLLAQSKALSNSESYFQTILLPSSAWPQLMAFETNGIKSKLQCGSACKVDASCGLFIFTDDKTCYHGALGEDSTVTSGTGNEAYVLVDRGMMQKCKGH